MSFCYLGKLLKLPITLFSLHFNYMYMGKKGNE